MQPVHLHRSTVSAEVVLRLQRDDPSAIGASLADAPFEIAEEILREARARLAGRQAEVDLHAGGLPEPHRGREQQRERQVLRVREPQPVLQAARRQVIPDVHLVMLQRPGVERERTRGEEVRQRRRVVVHRGVHTEQRRAGVCREQLLQRALHVDARRDREDARRGDDVAERPAVEVPPQRLVQL